MPRPIDIEKPLPQAGWLDRTRIKIFGKLYHSILVQNTVTRRIIAAAVKTMIKRYRVYLEKKKRNLLSQKVV